MTSSYTYCNFFLGGKDKLARALNKGNSTLLSFPIITLAQTPTWTQTLALVPASVPGLPGIYTNMDLQKVTKLALKFFIKSQEYGQLQVNTAFCICSLKAQNSDLYYKSLDIEGYYFCQQYKTYFDIAKLSAQTKSFFPPYFSVGVSTIIDSVQISLVEKNCRLDKATKA